METSFKSKLSLSLEGLIRRRDRENEEIADYRTYITSEYNAKKQSTSSLMKLNEKG